MLCLLGAFAALSLIASGLPAWVAWPSSCLALGYGFKLAHDEARKPARTLVIADNGTQTSIDGNPVAEFAVNWRGPLAFAHWHDGQHPRQRLVWWPDTLPAASRRELRLAVPTAAPARHTGSMAT